jgi:hypothetical protein
MADTSMKKPKKKKKTYPPWDPRYVDPETGEKVWIEDATGAPKPKKKKKKKPSDVTDEAEDTAEDLKKRNKKLRDLYGEPTPKQQKEGLE